MRLVHAQQELELGAVAAELDEVFQKYFSVRMFEDLVHGIENQPHVVWSIFHE